MFWIILRLAMHFFSTSRRRLFSILTLTGFLLALFFISIPPSAPDVDVVAEKRASKLEKQQRKKARADYFHRLLRDPTTDEVPANIRNRELAFAKTLPQNASKAALWDELGPNNVGGRTRALAIDVNNPNIIIAGGVSGGIWKSTNGGQSWVLKTDLDESHSVTWVVQDPRPGNTNVWYHASGEFSGNSARGNGANFFGSGIWKSVDNGESWQLLPATLPGNLTQFDHVFDFVSRLEINPATGSLFVTTNCCGLFRSLDGGNSFEQVLGGTNEHEYTDVSVSGNGEVVMAVLSQTGGAAPSTSPGIHVSLQDGAVGTWVDVTPDDFTTAHQRSVSAFAPSDPNVAYLMTFTGFTTDGGQNFYEVDDDVRVYRFDFDLDQGVVNQSNRSANMPMNLGTAGGVLTTQGSYDMILAVKPDDPDFVVFGGTNLYRTRDGFTTPVGLNDWIGGYSPANPNVYAQYPSHHPDQHSLVFDPSNPNRLWSGHDGGIGTADVTAATVNWTSQNNAYNVTQFYHVSIHDDANDERIVGGAQDNGSPFMVLSASSNSLLDVSSGDGAFAYLGDDFMYSSSQQGNVIQVTYGSNAQAPGIDFPENGRALVVPPNAQGQLFIHPFEVDPQDENTIYYPVQNTLWRNTNLSAAPNNDGTLPGWEQFNFQANGVISALAASRDATVPNRLYFAASSNGQPQVARVEEANGASPQAFDVSIPQAVAGAYANCIAVNPRNADELLVVMSNYNIVGLFHSTDAGGSWTAVEGNLEGNANTPGPSLRCATILPTGNETQYLLATSTGLFSTTSLNGGSTVWEQEAGTELGNVVVSYITSRPSDGRVVAATHGRGFFSTEFRTTGGGPAVVATNVSSLNFQVAPGAATSTTFQIQNVGGEVLDYSVGVNNPTENVPVDFSGPVISQTVASDTNQRIRFDGAEATPYPLKRVPSTHSASGITVPAQNDVLVLDDGDNAPDDFIGFGNVSPFIWANEFRPAQSFQLENFLFFMQSEQASANNLTLSVTDDAGNVLASGTAEFSTAPNGDWFSGFVDPVINFEAGEAFRIIIGTQGGVNFPAGVDANAQVSGQSFFSGDGTNFTSLEDTQFSGSAFLIRAVGTLGGGGGGGNPSLSVAPTNGSVAPGNAQTITVTLDASGVAAGVYQGSLQVNSNGGNVNIPVTVNVDENVATDEAEVPEGFQLAQNYPNPFNPSTRIEYTLAQPAEVNVRVFDLAGRLVTTLEARTRPAGTFALTWDGRNAAGTAVASGTYLYRLEAQTVDGRHLSQTRSMVLLK